MRTLISGDMNKKLIRTYEKRPDLLEQYPLTEKDREILETYKKKLKND